MCDSKSCCIPCLKDLWFHVLISLKIIPWRSRMRSKTCTSIIFKYPFLFTFPIRRILFTILKELNHKWLKRFIIMCQMTQCMTHSLCNMFSCYTNLIWGNKVVPQNFILFGMMDTDAVQVCKSLVLCYLVPVFDNFLWFTKQLWNYLEFFYNGPR